MRHRFINWFYPSFTLLVVVSLVYFGIKSFSPDILDLTWRPYGFVVLCSISVMSWLLYILKRRSSLQSGAYFWFFGFVSFNLLWQVIMLVQALSANPAAAAFWQGVLPVAWIPVPVMLVFFTLSYIDGTDMPKRLGTWSVTLMAMVILAYLAGVSGVIESHVPTAQVYDPRWGFNNEAGPYEWIIFLWLFASAMVSLGLFMRAHKRAVSTNQRRQLKLFIIALGQYIFLAIAADIVLYSFYPNIPTTSAFYGTILCLLIANGILKHGVFRIDPGSLAVPILENLTEAVIAVNRDFVAEFANHGAESMFGMSQEDIRGKTIERIFGRELAQVFRATLREQEVFQLSDRDISSGHGKEISTDITVSTFRYGDKVAGYIFVIQNVSELKKKSIELQHEKAHVEQRVVERTEQLHEERARLKASIEALSLGFVLVDAEGKIIIQNKSFAKMLQHQEALKHIRELNKHMKGFDAEAFCRRVQEGHKAIGAQEMVYGAKIFRIFGAPVVVEGKKSDTESLGAVLLVEDITEVKVLERSRDEFFSIASHELRTPLTAIRGNASMALQYYAESMKEPELKEVMSDIHDSSVRLIEIVNDFLDSSRLEQGKIAFDLRECSIEKIVEKVVYEMKAVINEKKLYVTFDAMALDKLPKLWADENRVKQIVYNLVGNAVTYTDKGGVTISASVEDKMVKLVVADTGRGIAVESQKLLFHKLQQAGDSILTRESTRGTGLGLYISRMLAEKMGGSLVLVQSAAGKGASFALYLPVASEDAKAGAAERGTIDATTGLTIID